MVVARDDVGVGEGGNVGASSRGITVVRQRNILTKSSSCTICTRDVIARGRDGMGDG